MIQKLLIEMESWDRDEVVRQLEIRLKSMEWTMYPSDKHKIERAIRKLRDAIPAEDPS